MMIDILPFLRVSGGTAEEKINDICDYLIQLKETLEFALMNITSENLSKELIDKLNRLGADIRTGNDNTESAVRQLSSKSVTIPGVCSSEIFKQAVEVEFDKLIGEVKVNLTTGKLEHEIETDIDTETEEETDTKEEEDGNEV